MDNPLFYFLVGFGTQLILFLLYKKLRTTAVYWTAFLVVFFMGLLGVVNYGRPALEMSNGNAASFLFLPLLFIIYFGAFRKLFISIYQNEPLMAQQFAWSSEQGEYRNLHYGDSIFTVSTLFLPFLTVLVLS